jgi:hypothetical protein
MSQNAANYQNSKWQPTQGWLGIVPGVSTLQQAIAKFGLPETNHRLANGTCYLFANKKIEATVLDSDKQSNISLLRILSDCPYQDSIPETIAKARTIFGPLRQTNVGESSMVTFERPGVRIGCELYGNPPKIKCLEFYPNP